MSGGWERGSEGLRGLQMSSRLRKELGEEGTSRSRKGRQGWAGDSGETGTDGNVKCTLGPDKRSAWGDKAGRITGAPARSLALPLPWGGRDQRLTSDLTLGSSWWQQWGLGTEPKVRGTKASPLSPGEHAAEAVTEKRNSHTFQA